jgi:diacylglycerol kinase family enzyme
MATASPEAIERLEALLQVGTPGPRKRMMIIVNPYATTVSDRLKKLVVYALRGSYDVTSIDTEARNHATELCRRAAEEGYDVVVAFGGDGTVNEAANGLAGSATALTCLPGGRTNVYCRMLGIPIDVVDATEHLLRLAHLWEPRQVDLGVAGERRFLFSAGVGLDASVVERVDAHPHLKARMGEWYYTAVTLRTFHRPYLMHPPRLEVEVDGQVISGVSAFVQNGTPYTYFGDRPIVIDQEGTLENGVLSAAVLERVSPIDLPTIAWRALSRRAQLGQHRHMRTMAGVDRFLIRSLDDRPLPLQVDGDYIGNADEVEFTVAPGALRVVS